MDDIARLKSARTFLFVPGDRPDRFAKALAAGADAVILDLEDAVAADAKPAARAAVADWLDPARPVLVRLNGVDSPWFAEDAALADRPGVRAVVLPKAESRADIERIPAPVVALIETAKGVASIADIAAARNVVRVAFGAIDFMVDMGISEDAEALAAYRAQLALASRVAGLAPPIDGVSEAIHDAEAVAADTRRALRFGFTGRLCIHPAQVAPMHAAFRPTEAETAWARRVQAAVAESSSGALQVDGRMIDRPVIEKATRILERAR